MNSFSQVETYIARLVSMLAYCFDDEHVVRHCLMTWRINAEIDLVDFDDQETPLEYFLWCVLHQDGGLEELNDNDTAQLTRILTNVQPIVEDVFPLVKH